MNAIGQRGEVWEAKEVRSKAIDSARFIALGPQEDSYYTIDGPTIRFWHHTSADWFSVYSFDDEEEIIGVSSLPFEDGSEGAVIAVNTSEKKEGPSYLSFAAYYSFKHGVVERIGFYYKITCITTIVDNLKRREISELNRGLQDAPHLIAVGFQGGRCVITYFRKVKPERSECILSPPPFTTNVLKRYLKDGNFLLIPRDGQRQALNPGLVEVTALDYISKCKLLLIGLSCGAVVLVTLSSRTSTEMYCFSKGSVSSFAWQEPNDDPRPALYLWTAHEAIRKNYVGGRSAHAILAMILFPEDEGRDSDEWKFDDPMIQPCFAWFIDSASAWMSMRTIVQKKGADQVDGINANLSSLNESSLCGQPTTDSTLLLMTWFNNSGYAEGALFDLNQYYFKRLVKQVVFDGTVARQNAFLSRFLVLTDHKYGVPLDVKAYAKSFRRFQSPWSEVNETLFQSSARNYSLAVITDSHQLIVRIDSIQEEVLKSVQLNIVSALGSGAELSAAWINAVGLACPYLPVDVHPEWKFQSVVVNALLYHSSQFALQQWIKECKSEESLMHISNQLWEEVEAAKEKFDELARPLYSPGMETLLPKMSLFWMETARFLFQTAAVLFADIAAKGLNGDKEAEIECHRRAAANLAKYLKLTLTFISWKLLDESAHFAGTCDQISEDLRVRGTRARQAGKKLFIFDLIEEMQAASNHDFIWLGQNAEAWYPPKSVQALLAPVLLLSVTDNAKLKLLGYFLLDYDAVRSTNLFDRFEFLELRTTDAILGKQVRCKHDSDCGIEMPQSTTFGRYRKILQNKVGPRNNLKALLQYTLLDRRQIELVKECLLKMKDGITRWNCFCMQRKYFHLLLRPTDEPKDEQWKNDCDNWARRILQEAPPSNNIRLPSPVREKWSMSGEVSILSPTSQSSFVTVERRGRDLAAREPPFDSLRPSSRKRGVLGLFEEKQPLPAKSSRIEETENGLEAVIIAMNEAPVLDNDAAALERVLPRGGLENVRRVLQTPPSLRRLTRAAAGVPLSFASPGTPFSTPAMPPTSILKTTKKKEPRENHETLPRPRLRFDLPSSSEDSSVLCAQGDESFEQVTEKYSAEEQDDPELLPNEVQTGRQNFGLCAIQQEEGGEKVEEFIIKERSFEQQEEPEETEDFGAAGANLQQLWDVTGTGSENGIKQRSFEAQEEPEEMNITIVTEPDQQQRRDISRLVCEGVKQSCFEAQEEPEEVDATNAGESELQQKKITGRLGCGDGTKKNSLETEKRQGNEDTYMVNRASEVKQTSFVVREEQGEVEAFDMKESVLERSKNDSEVDTEPVVIEQSSESSDVNVAVLRTVRIAEFVSTVEVKRCDDSLSSLKMTKAASGIIHLPFEESYEQSEAEQGKRNEIREVQHLQVAAVKSNISAKECVIERKTEAVDSKSIDTVSEEQCVCFSEEGANEIVHEVDSIRNERDNDHFVESKTTQESDENLEEQLPENQMSNDEGSLFVNERRESDVGNMVKGVAEGKDQAQDLVSERKTGEERCSSLKERVIIIEQGDTSSREVSSGQNDFQCAEGSLLAQRPSSSPEQLDDDSASYSLRKRTVSRTPSPGPSRVVKERSGPSAQRTSRKVVRQRSPTLVKCSRPISPAVEADEKEPSVTALRSRIVPLTPSLAKHSQTVSPVIEADEMEPSVLNLRSRIVSRTPSPVSSPKRRIWSSSAASRKGVPRKPDASKTTSKNLLPESSSPARGSCASSRTLSESSHKEREALSKILLPEEADSPARNLRSRARITSRTSFLGTSVDDVFDSDIGTQPITLNSLADSRTPSPGPSRLKGTPKRLSMKRAMSEEKTNNSRATQEGRSRTFSESGMPKLESRERRRANSEGQQATRTRPKRIRAGRITRSQVLSVLEEEEVSDVKEQQKTPARSSARLKKTAANN